MVGGSDEFDSTGWEASCLINESATVTMRGQTNKRRRGRRKGTKKEESGKRKEEGCDRGKDGNARTRNERKGDWCGE